MSLGFSQNDEEKAILSYFGDYIGRFIEVGAWDGRCMSNCHALALRGWGGVCVEPDPPALAGLVRTYDGRDDIAIVNAALTNFNGQTEFHSSGGGGVSTLSDAHRAKWADQTNFRTMYVEAMTPRELLRQYPGTYELVSIDVESENVNLLELFPLSEIGCKLLCIEHDNQDARIRQYAARHDLFTVILRNKENIIIGR